MPSTNQLQNNSRSMNGLNTVNANAVYTDSLEVGTLQIDTLGTAPTATIGDNSTKIATTAFVQNSVSSAGGSYVSLSGTQTITGDKTFSGTTTISGTENITVTLAGVAKTVSIPSGITTHNAAGIGTYAFPGWIVDYQDSKVEFLATSVGPKTGTFSIASSGTLVATSTTAQTGIAHSSNWIYQNDWNFDTLTGV